jgi:hypothetical protein
MRKHLRLKPYFIKGLLIESCIYVILMYKEIINLFIKSDLCVLFKIYYLINLMNY